MEPKHIASSQNKYYKDALRQREGRAAREAGVFVVEGLRSLKELSEAGTFTVESLWLDEKLEKEKPAGHLQLLQAFGEAPAYQIPHDMFGRLSETQTPQGALAFVRRKRYFLEECLGRQSLLVILENIQDPGNAGTMLRTAHALGATGVFLAGSTCDVYSPKVVRASMGSVLHLPFVGYENVSLAVRDLHERGVMVVAAALGQSRFPWDVDLRKPAALLIGNEGAGLSREAISCADCCVRIPMPGGAESLNAAVSCGMLLYEAMRQRR